MKTILLALLLAVLALAAVPASPAQAQGEAWLNLVDAAQYDQSYTSASAFFRSHLPQQQWVQMVGSVRGPLGQKTSRKMKSLQLAKTLPGAPDGNYAVLTFESSFANKASAVETLAMTEEAGAWRMAGYFIR